MFTMEEISIPLMDFIRSNFLSIEQLRIFLLLRNTRDQIWGLHKLSTVLSSRRNRLKFI